MCGATQSTEFFFGCSDCGSLLHLVSPRSRPVSDLSSPGIWSGLGTLGVAELTPVSLDEGRTPLLRAVDGRATHYIKFEGSNPTGSWKDRFHAVNATMARQLGYRGLSVVSTGNSALAAAAYANRARLQLRVRLATRAPKTIVHAIRDMVFEVELEDAEGL
jgi:threonine synthase